MTKSPLSGARGIPANPDVPSADREADDAASLAEIEDILHREAADLAPESHVEVRPVEISTREMNQMRFGRWLIWFILGFLILSLWNSVRS